ncbi:hypothetical protein HK413_13445 [Mucilaginibacter sp. S1162]|uniref:DUF4405 domain-containing protein n=1 Tax=Mucilaginibacter humi TaxID=2732510 RepID=A0ABX1W7Q6_9SPHI|nr:hypothetical protein [Mucilaginibacter humi]
MLKFLLTFVASVVLVNHMSTVSHMASLVTMGKLSGPEFEGLRVRLLVHASGGLVVLMNTTVLSVYKPWGKTGDKERRRYLFLALAGMAVLFVILHLIHGGPQGHH